MVLMQKSLTVSFTCVDTVRGVALSLWLRGKESVMPPAIEIVMTLASCVVTCWDPRDPLTYESNAKLLA